MQYSVVNKSRLYGNLRIDAEFYSPEFLFLEKILCSHQTTSLSTYSFFVKKGIFDLSPDYYMDKGIPLIRTSEIKDPLIDFSTTVYLDEKTHEANKKTELNSGDIVFTKIGAYIGDIAILPEKYNRYNFSQNVTGVKLKKDEIKSGFLLAFLLSKYGNQQIKRILMLSGQGKLELEDIKNIRIVLLGDAVKSLSHDLILKAESLKEKSVNIYQQAEHILLSELGLLNWKPKHSLSFVNKFSDSQTANRIDAEYFQPKYDEILKVLKNYNRGFIPIKNLFKQNKTVFRTHPDEQYRYVEIGSVNITTGEIDPLILLGKDLPPNAKIKLIKGDVIISKVRTYRGAVSIIKDDNLIGSSAFTVLQESEKVNKETLFIYLKMSPILELSLKYNAGTSYPVIDEVDIFNLPFPIIPDNLQEEIKKKVTEMYRANVLSKRLLDIAKHGVEIAIEKNEQTAIKWLEKQVEGMK
jgi:restriction endonuclease S subunit